MELIIKGVRIREQNVLGRKKKMLHYGRVDKLPRVLKTRSVDFLKGKSDGVIRGISQKGTEGTLHGRFDTEETGMGGGWL